ncbi:MAG: hypothetical protein CMN28_14155 [Salinisphaeraceae bacterium]|jgi:hypothetical protein|nr:hypothetical protein [Salinisphaeraceae bacterium]
MRLLEGFGEARSLRVRAIARKRGRGGFRYHAGRLSDANVMVLRHLQIVIDILLLRRGPQDLPAAWESLGFLGASYCFFSVCQMLIMADPGSAILHGLAATLMLALFVHGLLRVRGRPERFVQTLSALYGVGIVIVLVLLGPTTVLAPFVEAMNSSPDTAAAPPAPVVLAYLAGVIWSLIVSGHIYRHALDLGLAGGIAMALLFEFLVFMLFSLSGLGV